MELKENFNLAKLNFDDLTLPEIEKACREALLYFDQIPGFQ